MNNYFTLILLRLTLSVPVIFTDIFEAVNEALQIANLIPLSPVYLYIKWPAKQCNFHFIIIIISLTSIQARGFEWEQILKRNNVVPGVLALLAHAVETIRLQKHVCQ